MDSQPVPSSPLSQVSETDFPEPSFQPGSPGNRDGLLEVEQPPVHLGSQKRRISRKAKLDMILAVLERHSWGLADLLREVRDRGLGQGEQPYARAWRQFKRFAYVEVPGHVDAKQSLNPRETDALRPWCVEITAETLRQEIATLSQQLAFGRFDNSQKDVKVQVESLLAGAPAAIVDKAPTWIHILNVSQNNRLPRHPIITDSSKAQELAQKSILIFSRLCNLMHARLADGIPALLGIYLYEGGARTRVIDVLSRLGVCMTSQTIVSRIHALEGVAEENVRKLGRDATSIVTWDNFEFREGRRGERAGDQTEFRSITTALITANRRQTAQPLLPRFWRPKESPLSAVGILTSINGSRFSSEIRLFLIESCFKDLVGGHTEIWATSPIRIQRLPNHKTHFLPLKPILRDESSTENNIRIIEDIFERQMQLKAEDETYWSSKLRLVSGDLKTWSRIQSAKDLRRDTASNSYESLRWTIPILGLWHLRYNLLQLIHRIHWGGSAQDSSTLQYAADGWGRTGVLDGKKFAPIEELIMHSYRSRVVGVLIALLRQQEAKPITLEDLSTWIGLQSKDTWREILTSIERRLQPPSLLPTSDDLEEAFDQVRHNHQKFCAHVEIYLLLRYAIKTADIGLLRLALRHTTIMFLPSESSTPKYAAALLHTLHLVDSPASDPQLQEHILANSLVNLRGLEDSNFEHDRLLELHNNALKTYQQERTIFSSHNDELLQRWALLVPITTGIKTAIQAALGFSRSSAHPTKNSREDIWRMASSLSGNFMKRRQQDRFSMHPAPDLFALGLARLGEAVVSYNEALKPLAETLDDTIATQTSSEEDPTFEPVNDPFGSPTLDAAACDEQMEWLLLDEAPA